MDRQNWKLLGELDRQALKKVLWLGAFLDDGPIEVKDPYGLGDAKVRQIIQTMRAANSQLAARLSRSRRSK